MINMDKEKLLNLSTLKCSLVKLKECYLNVPLFLFDAFNLLNCGGIKNEGIFRKSGNMQRTENMKCPFYGEFCLPEGTTIYDVCFLIKQFFRQLEEPLLTEALEPQFLHFQMMDCEKTRTRCVLELCHILPPRHRETLAYLMRKLQNVARFSEHNKMDAKNLALAFVESIFSNNSSFDPLANDEERVQQKLQDNDTKAKLLEFLINNAENIGSLTEYEQIMSPDMYDSLLPEDRKWDVNSKERDRYSGHIRDVKSLTFPTKNNGWTPVTSKPKTSLLAKRKSMLKFGVEPHKIAKKDKKVSIIAHQEAKFKLRDVPSEFAEHIPKLACSVKPKQLHSFLPNKRKASNSVYCRVCGKPCCCTTNFYRKHFKKHHPEYILEDMSNDCWKCHKCSDVFQNLIGLRKHWSMQHNESYSREIFRDFVKQAYSVINLESSIDFSEENSSFAIEISTRETKTEKDDEAPPAQGDLSASKTMREHRSSYSATAKKVSMMACREAEFIPTDTQMKIAKPDKSKPNQNDKEFPQCVSPKKRKKPIPFKCRLCGINCYDLAVYRKHFKKRHAEFGVDDMFDNGWKCDKCFQVFRSFIGLRKHWILRHNESYSKEMFRDLAKQVGNGINSELSTASSKKISFPGESSAIHYCNPGIEVVSLY